MAITIAALHTHLDYTAWASQKLVQATLDLITYYREL
jgi:hypothetical protein